MYSPSLYKTPPAAAVINYNRIVCSIFRSIKFWVGCSSRILNFLVSADRFPVIFHLFLRGRVKKIKSVTTIYDYLHYFFFVDFKVENPSKCIVSYT